MRSGPDHCLLVNKRVACANSLRSQLPNARRSVQNWQLWAVAAALSAAVTALLIKVGVQGVDAGMATLFRTLAVAIVLALVLLVSGRLDWQELRVCPLSAWALSPSPVWRQVSRGSATAEPCSWGPWLGWRHSTSSVLC